MEEEGNEDTASASKRHKSEEVEGNPEAAAGDNNKQLDTREAVVTLDSKINDDRDCDMQPKPTLANNAATSNADDSDNNKIDTAKGFDHLGNIKTSATNDTKDLPCDTDDCSVGSSPSATLPKPIIVKADTNPDEDNNSLGATASLNNENAEVQHDSAIGDITFNDEDIQIVPSAVPARRAVEAAIDSDDTSEDDNDIFGGARGAGGAANNDDDSIDDFHLFHSRSRPRTFRTNRNYIDMSLSSWSTASSPRSDEVLTDSSVVYPENTTPARLSLYSTTDSESEDEIENHESDDNIEDDYESRGAAENANLSPEEVEKRTKDAVQEILNKKKSPYTWHSTQQLLWREQGLIGNLRHSLRQGPSSYFNSCFYGARHVVESMKLSHTLKKHIGCVNCLNFNRTGELLCSGSDDQNIVVWDWANKKQITSFKSGHTENIFQTKFFDTSGCLIIISASRDGQVRRSVIPSSGGSATTERLYKHLGAVHKLVISPQNRQEIISVGEDALVMQYDLRSNDKPVQLTKVTNPINKKMRLYSISHHPFAPEFCVSGFDGKVRVYDKRNCENAVRELYPHGVSEQHTMPQITCAVYNYNGSEVLASYSDQYIYLFDNKNYKPGEYLHCYRGHFNHRTIKGVNFFGPNSEYIISGSDCGHIFFWDKETESILNFLHGDRTGVVNCLEPHPSMPILATSGLDFNVKIFTPSGERKALDLAKMERCIYHNMKRSTIEEFNLDDMQFQTFMRQLLRTRNRNANEDSSTDDDNGLVYLSSSSGSSTSNDGDDDGGINDARLGTLHCRTQ